MDPSGYNGLLRLSDSEHLVDMPYSLERVGRGYKVFSQSGTPLSKKPLSLLRAKKQLTAVNIAYATKKK